MIIPQNDILILAIESSCDDTAAAVLQNRAVLSNVVANQEIHRQYGGVVPELAGRDHQKNIVPVVSAALKKAKTDLNQLHAVAYTRGPGLQGSLLVGASFAKSLAQSLSVPLIEVHHMQAHVLVHFIDRGVPEEDYPRFPFLCLTVSGGHTQLIVVKDHLSFELLGETRDDAVGEAYDKAAKILGLPYPGGPLIDKLAADGDPKKYGFPISTMPAYDFSFSGIKTAFLYFIRDETKKNPLFVTENIADLCASFQFCITEMVMRKVRAALAETGLRDVALAGGVSANSLLRERMNGLKAAGYRVFVPEMQYCTDNAAMIGITGYYKFLRGEYASLSSAPLASFRI